MEQARRNLLRCKRLAATESSIRFRKIDALAARLAAQENACTRSSLEEVEADASSGAASVIEATPTPSFSIPNISHHSVFLTLQAFHAWREKNRSVITYLKRQATIRKNRERAERRLSPHWTKAKEIDRAPAYMSAILESGMATAFTLNFAPRILQAAEKATHGVFDHLRRRISLELKKALGDSVGLVCALDKTTSGRWHIHGALALDPSQRDLAVAALRRAGGKWAKGTGQLHQLHMQADQWSLTNDDFSDVQQPLDAGWANYCIKIAKRLRKETNHSVLYASQEIKQRAQEIYSSNRGNNRPEKGITKSINTDLQANFSSETPLVSESKIDSYRPAINTDRGTKLENADCFARILRRPVSGHGLNHDLARRETHRHRPAPRAWPDFVHPGRHHDRRRSLAAPRSGRPLHQAPRRADGARARHLRSPGCRLINLDPQATGPPVQIGGRPISS